MGDEVYGLSEFRQSPGEEGFVSALNVVRELKERKSEGEINDEFNAEENENNGQELPSIKPNANKSDIDLSRIHIIWSLSKDLGCSGLRMLYMTLPFPFPFPFPFNSPATAHPLIINHSP